MSQAEQVNQETPNEPTVLEYKVTGTVRWFSVSRGYGFIKRDGKEDRNDDIFVHRSGIIENDSAKFQQNSLDDEERVEFDVIQGAKGFQAINVSGPDGAAVKGSRYAQVQRSQPPRKNNFNRNFGRNRPRNQDQRGQQQRAYQEPRVHQQTQQRAHQEPPAQQLNQQQAVDKNIIASKVIGNVKWFNMRAGFGFITRENPQEDIFVHYTGIISNGTKKFNRGLTNDETVLFDISQSDKGNEAINVTRPDGTPISAIRSRSRYNYGFPQRQRQNDPNDDQEQEQQQQQQPRRQQLQDQQQPRRQQQQQYQQSGDRRFPYGRDNRYRRNDDDSRQYNDSGAPSNRQYGSGRGRGQGGQNVRYRVFRPSGSNRGRGAPNNQNREQNASNV